VRTRRNAATPRARATAGQSGFGRRLPTVARATDSAARPTLSSILYARSVASPRQQTAAAHRAHSRERCTVPDCSRSRRCVFDSHTPRGPEESGAAEGEAATSPARDVYDSAFAVRRTEGQVWGRGRSNHRQRLCGKLPLPRARGISRYAPTSRGAHQGMGGRGRDRDSDRGPQIIRRSGID
jgi:hypothetical protein